MDTATINSPNPKTLIRDRNLGTMERERDREPVIKRETAMDADDDTDIINFVEYRRTDMAKAAPDFWDSLDEARKKEFLSVSLSDLAKFCSEVIQEAWLVNFLSDAVVFFELHGTWVMYLCPDQECLRLFNDDESLITHLKYEHLPQIYPVTWPSRQHNLAEERRCADALCKMVWKPIIVEHALDLLSILCLDVQNDMAYEFSGFDWLYSLNWPYSEDPERKRLLVELEKEFQVLLAQHHQASFSLLSDGYFTKMTALASKHIFVGRPPTLIAHLIQGLLALSPLSFCLLEAADLSRFVKLVVTMSNFVKKATLPSAEEDVSWNKSDILDVLSFSPNESLFSFNEAETLCSGDRVSILSLLCNGACIPSIPRVPSKANETLSCVLEVLNEHRECQTTAGPTHQISSNQPWRVCFEACNCVYRLKHQANVPLDNSWDCVPPFMEESFSPSWTIQPLWDPNSCFSFRDGVKADRIESHFQREQIHLRLVNRVLCLESQLRILCALDCRMYILPLMKSFLRLKLYFYLRCRRLEMREENPAAQLPMIPYLEDYTEQEVIHEDIESECNSDYDSDLDDKPWRDNPTLCCLDSTLSESATAKTEGCGPFFWMAISDVLRYCEDCHGVDKSVREGIRRFVLNKTWKYWRCYTCDSKFIDRESHMVHLEDEHQLCIAHDEYWLIPQQDSRDDGGKFKQDVVKRELALEDSITLDHTYNYFLVDSAKFYEMPSADEEERHRRAKDRQYHEIVHDLQNQLHHLKNLFQNKREILMCLEAVNALVLMLFDGTIPLLFIVGGLLNPTQSLDISNFSCNSMKPNPFHQFLIPFLSQLCQSNGRGSSVGEAFNDIKDDLNAELHLKDLEILRAVDQIDNMKRCLSDLCVCDYRTEFVPPVRLFLHANFKFDNNLRSLECNNVKEFLPTLDQLLDRGRAYYFNVTVLSPGRVIINALKNKSSWAFAFIGIRLSFVGKWFDVALTGSFNFGCWTSQCGGSCGRSGSVTPEDSAVIADWHNVNITLCRALGRKLASLVRMYGEKISCNGIGMNTN